MDHLVCFLPAVLATSATNGRPLHEAFADMSARDHAYMSLAINLTDTCNKMYTAHASHLAPEITFFAYRSPDPLESVDLNRAAVLDTEERDVLVKAYDAFYILRPEAIEAMYFLYSYTGDERYKRWGWAIFEAIQRYLRVPPAAPDSGDANHAASAAASVAAATADGDDNDDDAAMLNVDSGAAAYTTANDVRRAPPGLHERNAHPKMQSFFLAETLKYLFLLFDDDAAARVSPSTTVFNTEAHPLPRLRKIDIARFHALYHEQTALQAALDAKSPGGGDRSPPRVF